MTTKKAPINKFNPDRLLALLESREKTVAECADSIGVSRQLMYRWIKGETIPGIHACLDMCDFFEVEIGFFFTYSKKKIQEMALA